MRARRSIMLTAVLFLAVYTSIVQARTFNVTHLIVPEIVPADQHEVDLECQYDANFTLLSWFKGRNEFFRYRPGRTPSTRSFPIEGVGTIEIIACGPTACNLRLGSLTEEATGTYKCDIERDVVPYKYATKMAHMEVIGHERRKPLVEGLAEEYGEGNLMQAYCRGSPDSEFRWYINGKELEDKRGLMTLKVNVTRFIFVGLHPTVTVQCAEYRNGKLYGSKEAQAIWNEARGIMNDNKELCSNGTSFNLNKFVITILYLLRYILL